MEKMRQIKIPFQGSPRLMSVPRTCPYCNLPTDITSDSSQVVFNSDNNTNKSGVLVARLKPHCCDKFYLATFNVEVPAAGPANATFDFLQTYPQIPAIVFDDHIKEISPRFVSLYDQVQKAMLANSIDLAGAGLRNALEILVRDFALNVLHEDPGAVKSKKFLSDAIDAYFSDIGLKSAADFIRKSGNDFTHYYKAYEQVDIEDLDHYIGLIVNAIIQYHKINNPPELVRRKKEQTENPNPPETTP